MQVCIGNVKLKIIHGTLVVQISRALQLKLYRAAITGHLAREATIYYKTVDSDILIVAIIKLHLIHIALQATIQARALRRATVKGHITRNKSEFWHLQQTSQLQVAQVGLGNKCRTWLLALHALNGTALGCECSISCLGSEQCLGAELAKAAIESTRADNLTRSVRDREHLLGQLTARDTTQHPSYIVLGSSEAFQIKIHNTSAHVRQSTKTHIAIQRTTLTKLYILHRDKHIGNRTLHRCARIAHHKIPRQEFGCEVCNI